MIPRIWVILGHRPGDNAQVLALAEELGLPFETRSLGYNWRHLLTGRFMGASRASLDAETRDQRIVPPWPDLIIAVGRRAVPIVRWIRAQAGGRTKLVLVGHPRVHPRLFDLVFTTRQYDTPSGPSMRLLPVAMSRFRTPPQPAPEERAWLDSLPRPHLLMMVGGTTRYWQLTPEHMASTANALAARAGRLGGSLLVAGSARTRPEVLDAIERATAGDPTVRVLRSDHPRFAVLVDDADELFPTADSVSMVSESIVTGKPVGMIDPERSISGKLLLGDGFLRVRIAKRDLRRFWTFVRGERLVGTIDAPLASDTPNPVAAAAIEVRRLIGLERT